MEELMIAMSRARDNGGVITFQQARDWLLSTSVPAEDFPTEFVFRFDVSSLDSKKLEVAHGRNFGFQRLVKLEYDGRRSVGIISTPVSPLHNALHEFFFRNYQSALLDAGLPEGLLAKFHRARYAISIDSRNNQDRPSLLVPDLALIFGFEPRVIFQASSSQNENELHEKAKTYISSPDVQAVVNFYISESPCFVHRPAAGSGDRAQEARAAQEYIDQRYMITENTIPQIAYAGQVWLSTISIRTNTYRSGPNNEPSVSEMTHFIENGVLQPPLQRHYAWGLTLGDFVPAGVIDGHEITEECRKRLIEFNGVELQQEIFEGCKAIAVQRICKCLEFQ